uniref:Reverse transcriptase domain-containing protein n=1 Tax=Latimeria chalumnae TaxID=7897 RepID=H3AA24_LATCH
QQNFTFTTNQKKFYHLLEEKVVRIKRGIFQGDSLSPLWFCLALNQLSKMLRNSGYGYSLGRRPTVLVSHLFYMDDLKLYAKNSDQLQSMLELVSSFSKSIVMEIGVDKCAILHAKQGKLERHDNIQLLNGAEIQEIEPEKCYKYLGMQQLLNINTMQKWLKLIMKTQLNTKTKRKVRATLKENHMHHPHASMAQLYLPRRVGGRGLLNLTDLCRGQEAGLRDYFLKKDLPIHQAATPLFLSEEDHGFEKTTLQSRLDEWSMKSLHGQFHATLQKDNIDVEASMTWLQKGTLFPETEGFILAIQDHVVATNNYQKYILMENISNKCCFCGTITESIQHTIDGCPVLSYSEYLHRHNNITKIIHQQFAKDTNVEVTNQWWKHQPKAVEETIGVKILWGFSIRTEREIQGSELDIVFVDKTNRKAKIIDIACPTDYNIGEKEHEKIMKYQDLKMEIEKLWKVRVEVIPVVIGAVGAVTKKHDSIK